MGQIFFGNLFFQLSFRCGLNDVVVVVTEKGLMIELKRYFSACRKRYTSTLVAKERYAFPTDFSGQPKVLYGRYDHPWQLALYTMHLYQGSSKITHVGGIKQCKYMGFLL